MKSVARRETAPVKSSMPRKQDNTGVLPPLVSLKCAVCEHYLQDPVSLPCLHSFCRGCLEQYNARNNSDVSGDQSEHEHGNQYADDFPPDTRETKSSENREEFLTVQCPTCIEVLGLAPPEEPQVPFENPRLARIVGLVQDSKVLCENCSEAQSEVRCKKCDAWLCLECREETHQAPIFQTHESEGLSHSEMFALPKCKTHPMNDLEFFSTEEEVGVCQVCLLKGDFVGKPYCLVSDIRKARQVEIEKGVRVIMEEKERLLVGRQRMDQIQDLLDKKLLQQTESVKNNFKAIRDALDKREAEVLASLTELKNTKEKVLEQQMAQTENILSTINDGIRNVKLILTHSNDLELVYLTIVLQEFISELAKIDAPRFGFKFNEPAKPLEYFHTAAVDAELPVILSGKVPELVSAYAPVPQATFEPVNKPGYEAQGVNRGKLRLEQPKLKGTQKEVLEQMGVEENAEEYGCSVQ